MVCTDGWKGYINLRQLGILNIQRRNNVFFLNYIFVIDLFFLFFELLFDIIFLNKSRLSPL